VSEQAHHVQAYSAAAQSGGRHGSGASGTSSFSEHLDGSGGLGGSHSQGTGPPSGGSPWLSRLLGDAAVDGAAGTLALLPTPAPSSSSFSLTAPRRHMDIASWGDAAAGPAASDDSGYAFSFFRWLSFPLSQTDSSPPQLRLTNHHQVLGCGWLCSRRLLVSCFSTPPSGGRRLGSGGCPGQQPAIDLTLGWLPAAPAPVPSP
jgi:hypothetical protein